MTPERLRSESSIAADMCSHLIYEVVILEITSFPNLKLSLSSVARPPESSRMHKENNPSLLKRALVLKLVLRSNQLICWLF
jgi:hypothetical protein